MSQSLSKPILHCSAPKFTAGESWPTLYGKHTPGTRTFHAEQSLMSQILSVDFLGLANQVKSQNPIGKWQNPVSDHQELHKLEFQPCLSRQHRTKMMHDF